MTCICRLRLEEKIQLQPIRNTAVEGGGWSSSRPGRFTPGKDPVRIVQVTGWASGPVCTGKENLAPTGIRSPARLRLRILFDTFSTSGTERELTNALSYKREVRGSDARWGYWIFHRFRPHCGAGVDLSYNRYEYQRCVVWVNAAGAWG
jgi:hypothetical protein